MPKPERTRPLRRPRRLRAKPKPHLSVKQILAWADESFERIGRWPYKTDGRIRGTLDETWLAVDSALWAGCRGFVGGSSLARLLDEHRGVRNKGNLPRLSVRQILAWADAHFKKTGSWPKKSSGAVLDSQEHWHAIDACLIQGCRGLPGGISLARLLAQRRGARHRRQLPPLTVVQILVWADAHHRRTGAWPKYHSGEVEDSIGETWSAIDHALSRGKRGLAGGSSLAMLLQDRRGVRNKRSLPRFRVRRILDWAKAYRRRNGKWPAKGSGPVEDSPGDTWMAVEMALLKGRRGLHGGSSLSKLLKKPRSL